MNLFVRVIAPFVAGTFALAACGWGGVAQAQQPGATTTQFAPVATPTIDPDWLKVPNAAAGTDAYKFKLDKTGPAAQPPAIPKGFDLGNYQFNFDTRHTRDVVAPGMATDSGEKSNLSKVAPGPKQNSVLPNYFGLKLSVPTH